MEFELTEEQRMIQDMARNFALKEVLPMAAELVLKLKSEAKVL